MLTWLDWILWWLSHLIGCGTPTQIQGCLRASVAVTLLAGLMVSILLIRSLASGVTVSHSGEGNCSRNDTETTYNFPSTINTVSHLIPRLCLHLIYRDQSTLFTWLNCHKHCSFSCTSQLRCFLSLIKISGVYEYCRESWKRLKCVSSIEFALLKVGIKCLIRLSDLVTDIFLDTKTRLLHPQCCFCFILHVTLNPTRSVSEEFCPPDFVNSLTFGNFWIYVLLNIYICCVVKLCSLYLLL